MSVSIFNITCVKSSVLKRFGCTLVKRGHPNGGRHGDAWLGLKGRALNVIDFLPQHPGGVLATWIVTDKDATAGYDMRHHPYVVEKCASSAIIDDVGTGRANRGQGGCGVGLVCCIH